MQPAPRRASHDKLTSKRTLFTGLSAFATRFFLCLSPASNGSNVPARTARRFGHLSAAIDHFASARLAGAAGRGIVGGSLIELAVKRRAADFQPARDLGHLPPVMRADRKSV